MLDSLSAQIPYTFLRLVLLKPDSLWKRYRLDMGVRGEGVVYTNERYAAPGNLSSGVLRCHLFGLLLHRVCRAESMDGVQN